MDIKLATAGALASAAALPDSNEALSLLFDTIHGTDDDDLGGYAGIFFSGQYEYTDPQVGGEVEGEFEAAWPHFTVYERRNHLREFVTWLASQFKE